jgi:hypothetical protein
MSFPVFASGDVLNASDMNAVGMWLVASRTFTSTTNAQQIDNCFTSDFANYLIMFDVTTGTNGSQINMRLAAGGTPFIGAQYRWGRTYQDMTSGGATGSVGSNGDTVWYVVEGSNNGGGAKVELHDPQRTAYTWFTNQGIAANQFFSNVGGAMTNNTSYDGFWSQPSGGSSWVGTIRVYGLRN